MAFKATFNISLRDMNGCLCTFFAKFGVQDANVFQFQVSCELLFLIDGAVLHSWLPDFPPF